MDDWLFAVCEVDDFLREGGGAFAGLPEPAILTRWLP